MSEPDARGTGIDTGGAGTARTEHLSGGSAGSPRPPLSPTRFHGAVTLNATRVGRDAAKIAEEVVAHLAGLVGPQLTVTLEIHAKVPGGVSEIAVRIVTANCRTLKFSARGFETE